MPIYEYRCSSCGTEFEKLVRASDTPECPSCHGRDLDKLLPSFAVSSKEKTMQAAAKSRAKAAHHARRDNIAAEHEIERHRREDH